MPELPGKRFAIDFSPRNVWRVGWVIIGLAAIAAFLAFMLEDGGAVFFTVLISWFAAIAMEPAVARLSKYMRRGFATIIVMLTFAAALIIFAVLFGKLFLDQLVQIVEALPQLTDSVINFVNQKFGLTVSLDQVLESAGLTNARIAELATGIGGGLLGLLGSIVGSVFGLFTFGLFTFYLSADAPRFRRWIAGVFPARIQAVVVNVWDITAEKTGGYIGARVVLATINSSTTAIVFLVIGMPYWLALALWTGIVAQFVPTIGTYIAIVLPVIVGLLSPEPWVGIVALIWAVIYQQIENLTIEPKISARAVNVHPAVAFGSVLLGASLFGVAGAFLAIPVVAMLLAMFNIYAKRYELFEEKSLSESDSVTAESTDEGEQ